ncbi:MAG: hypothetical protein R2857_06875 [Vampirovibrionales bacterium]
MAKNLVDRVEDQGMALTIEDEVKDLLAKEGYSPSYGARPLRRVIQKKIEDEVSELMLLGKFKEGDHIVAKAENGKIVFEKGKKKPIKPKKKLAQGRKASHSGGGSSGSLLQPAVGPNRLRLSAF